MVTISDSSLRANVFETVYDLVNSNKSSWTTVGSKTINLYAKLPDDNPVFPCIIVHPVVVDKDTYSMDRTTMNKNVLVVLEIYSIHNKDIDTIADGLTSIFDTNKIKGITLISMSEDIGDLIPNNSKLKQKTITINYLRR